MAFDSYSYEVPEALSSALQRGKAELRTELRSELGIDAAEGGSVSFRATVMLLTLGFVMCFLKAYGCFGCLVRRDSRRDSRSWAEASWTPTWVTNLGYAIRQFAQIMDFNGGDVRGMNSRHRRQQRGGRHARVSMDDSLRAESAELATFERCQQPWKPSATPTRPTPPSVHSQPRRASAFGRLLLDEGM